MTASCDQEIAEQIADALGTPLFVPYTFIPKYRQGQYGRWKLVNAPMHLEPGYHTGLWVVRDMPVLLRSTGGGSGGFETWMSITPHEIESQELACQNAFGSTVVMGLGLGWIAINMALREQVRRVTVVERDGEVISLFAGCGAMDGLPEKVRGKIEIVAADAFDWIPQEKVDFLYVDIWRDLAEKQALDDVRRMQNNIHAKQVAFWGQELFIYSAMERRKSAETEGQGKDERLHQAVVEGINLPLMIPPNLDYVGLIDKVIELRRARKLPILPVSP